MSHDPSALFSEAYRRYHQQIVDKLEELRGPAFALTVTSSESGKSLVEAHAYALSSSKWYGDRRAAADDLTRARVEAAASAVAEWSGN